MGFYVSGYAINIQHLRAMFQLKYLWSDTTSWHHVVGTYDGSTIKKIYLGWCIGVIQGMLTLQIWHLDGSKNNYRRLL